MSAIGDDTVILSVGFSCQPAEQINTHVPLLRELTGDVALAKHSLPFDWLITSIRSLPWMLETGAYFPETRQELRFARQRIHSPHAEILYWHLPKEAMNSDELFAEHKTKFDVLANRMANLGEKKRIVAILANTQVNIPNLDRNWKFGMGDVTIQQAAELRDTLSTYFRRPVEMVLVRPGPIEGEEKSPDVADYLMKRDDSGWQGNANDWANVFKDYFG